MPIRCFRCFWRTRRRPLTFDLLTGTASYVTLPSNLPALSCFSASFWHIRFSLTPTQISIWWLTRWLILIKEVWAGIFRFWTGFAEMMQNCNDKSSRKLLSAYRLNFFDVETLYRGREIVYYSLWAHHRMAHCTYESSLNWTFFEENNPTHVSYAT